MAIPVRQVPAGPKLREWARKNRVDEWRVARIVEVAKQLGLPPGPALNALRQTPPQYVRVHVDQQETLKRLRQEGFQLEPTSLDPAMFRVVAGPRSIGATHEHLYGFTTPQDVASSLPVLAMDPGDAEIIVDACSAPGGKTLHISDLLEGGCIVACEPNDRRRRSLRYNLDRRAARNVAVFPGRIQDLPGEAFVDRILVDAPCSGEGTFPKLRSTRRGQPKEIEELTQLQQEILDAADRVLKPGGILVYSTCAFSPEENEGIVDWLVRSKGYTVQPLPAWKIGVRDLLPGLDQWGEQTYDPSVRNARRTMPGFHPSLGFFVAKLQKGGVS